LNPKKKCARFTTYEVIDGAGDFDGLETIDAMLKDIEDRLRSAHSKIRDVIRGD